MIGSRRGVIYDANEAGHCVEDGNHRALASGVGSQKGRMAGGMSQGSRGQDGEQHKRARTGDCDCMMTHISPHIQ